MPPLNNLPEMWKSFGWNVSQCNGHNIEELNRSIRRMIVQDSPSVIIAETVKGKGISFMEDRHEWHVGGLSEKQIEQALKEIGGAL